MKKSLSKQVLFLSLAALVVVSTGCERRGRAPAKPKQENTAGGGQQNVAGDPTKTAAPKDDSSTAVTVEKAPEDARMDCSLTLTSGEPSAESFTQDFKHFQELSGCLQKNGIILSSTTADDPLKKEIFIIPDANALVGIKRKRSESDAEGALGLRDMFNQLALADGSNDDQARRILEARLDFFKVACQKMAARYEGKLDSSTKTADNQRTLGGILADLNLFPEAADNAIKELADFRTVDSDGGDLKPAAGDIH